MKKSIFVLAFIPFLSISIFGEYTIEQRLRVLEKKVVELEKRMESIDGTGTPATYKTLPKETLPLPKETYEKEESTPKNAISTNKVPQEITNYKFSEKISKTGFHNLADKILVGKATFSADAFRVDKVVKKDILNRQSYTDKKYAQIYISIINNSKTEFLDYTSPSGIFSNVKLEDNLGNEYLAAGFGFNTIIEGKIEGKVSMSPGAKISDIIVFDAPKEGVSALLLTFPAEQFKNKDKIRILINLK